MFFFFVFLLATSFFTSWMDYADIFEVGRSKFTMFQTRMSSWISFCAGYSGYGMRYTPNSSPYDGQGPYNRAEPSAPPQHLYTAGLSEQEQYEAAIRASLQDQGEGFYGLNTSIKTQ